MHFSILQILIENWTNALIFYNVQTFQKYLMANTFVTSCRVAFTHPLIHKTVVLNSLLIPVTHPSPPHFPSLPLLMLRWNPRSFLSQSGTHGPAEPLPVIITRLVIDAAVNHYDWHVWINWLIVEIRGLSYQQKALEFTNV